MNNAIEESSNYSPLATAANLALLTQTETEELDHLLKGEFNKALTVFVVASMDSKDQIAFLIALKGWMTTNNHRLGDKSTLPVRELLPLLPPATAKVVITKVKEWYGQDCLAAV